MSFSLILHIKFCSALKILLEALMDMHSRSTVSIHMYLNCFAIAGHLSGCAVDACECTRGIVLTKLPCEQNWNIY
ncbi:unnamed protein product [Fasciola hepatica]|uniref:Secreted protein n=1 Tax=Fasciola hepatica TaxID=6192 RepID=A0ABC9HHB5_FASHE